MYILSSEYCGKNLYKIHALLSEKLPLPSVSKESPADEEDADEHPRGHGRHALRVGAVGGDGVEDVDQHLNG
jgi:hypothetical protein